MAKRVSEEIDGFDIFTYDTDLLAAAHELRKPALLEIAKGRNYTSLYKLNKAELAVIVAAAWTYDRDEQRKLAAVNEQMTATLDEIAPTPAQTLREEYDGTAARFNPAVIDELHERAAAIDEKRTIARAFLSTPTGVVLTWNEIQRGYLDAMAERDRIEHNQAVRSQTERDEPRDLDIWLEPGVVLVGPNSGDRYRFVRWDGGTAVLSTPTGVPVRIDQADVTTWQYLPKASADGVAAAKRQVPWRETHVMHARTGQVYRVLGMDNILTGKLIISHACGSKCSEHERAISPGVLQWDYIACDENGNRFIPPSAPAYAVGDRVRWTEDRRPMFVRQVTPTGAYISPMPDGPLATFASFEDLSPELGTLYPSSGLDVIVQQRDELRAALDTLRAGVAWLIGYYQKAGVVPVDALEKTLKRNQ